MTYPVVTSAVVQAVGDAVTAALTGPLADWQVFDSIDRRQAYAPKSLMVGGTWDADVESFTGQDTVLTETIETGAGRRLTEVTTVQCVAYSGSGNWSFAQHRDEINAALAAIGGALRGIHSVGVYSARVQMSNQAWAPIGDDNGTGVMALFTITVTTLP